MAKSKDRSWIKKHVNDPYVKKAQVDGYRSRASYKLLEIVEKDRSNPIGHDSRRSRVYAGRMVASSLLDWLVMKEEFMRWIYCLWTPSQALILFRATLLKKIRF